MTNQPTESNPERGTGGPQKDMSLGPACLIVVVIGAVLLSVGMIALAALMGGNQGRRAAYSVREQLIPWVEQSSLSPTDRQNIVERMNDLSSDMEREDITARQLSRLAIRLTDSPILQWGVVEQLVSKANASSGFTNEEKQEFAAGCDRWLLAASQGKLSIQDMEFAVQNVATKDQRSGRLSIREDANDERLREFQRRVATISDKLAIPKEPFNKSVSQVFLQVIDEALQEKD
jgi:hypothetical protein